MANKILFSHITRYRWVALGWVLLVVLMALTGLAVMGPVQKQVGAIAQYFSDRHALGSSGLLEQRITQAEEQLRQLQQIRSIVAMAPQVDEFFVVKNVYSLADSNVCKVIKVEVLDTIGLEGGVEIPILFAGEGSFTAIARVVAGVENMLNPTRIRSLVLDATGSDNGKVALDFVVMKTKK